MVQKIQPIEPHVLEGICKTLGDSYSGLTGSEIGKILSDTKIVDIDQGNTKWKRLYNAFINYQNINQCSNGVLKFIQNALQPVRYIGNEEIFQNRRHEVNKRLSFIGFELSEKAKYIKTNQANTIAEAEERADKLRFKLEQRKTHDKVYEYCKAELLAENYFHSVFEATKSIADRLRGITYLYADGNELVETAFSTTNPLVKINQLANQTDRSEHLGLANIIKGIFGLIRNPTAHEPKIKYNIDEETALDMLNTVSFVHKMLDRTV